jgi:type III pantothenate kinase
VLLCIDVGNTHVSLGLYPDTGTGAEALDPEPERRWRLRTDTSATADELDLTVTGMLGAHFPEVTAVAALSTVPGPSRELRTLLSRWSDRMRTLVVGPGVRTGVPLLVDHTARGGRGPGRELARRAPPVRHHLRLRRPRDLHEHRRGHREG